MFLKLTTKTCLKRTIETFLKRITQTMASATLPLWKTRRCSFTRKNPDPELLQKECTDSPDLPPIQVPLTICRRTEIFTEKRKLYLQITSIRKPLRILILGLWIMGTKTLTPLWGMIPVSFIGLRDTRVPLTRLQGHGVAWIQSVGTSRPGSMAQRSKVTRIRIMLPEMAPEDTWLKKMMRMIRWLLLLIV